METVGERLRDSDVEVKDKHRRGSEQKLVYRSLMPATNHLLSCAAFQLARCDLDLRSDSGGRMGSEPGIREDEQGSHRRRSVIRPAS